MSKILDRIVKHSAWVVIILSMMLYFAFQILSFEGEIVNTLTSWVSWINLVLVVVLNVQMVSAAYDSAMNHGIETAEFKLADEINNRLIKDFNNDPNELREYVKELNKMELKAMQDDYLYQLGDKDLKDLTRKELKGYENIKPIVHNIYGFNLPLIFEMTKGRNINYQASIDANKGKRWRQVKKAAGGLLFGAMTLEMVVRLENFGSALTALIIVSSGLALTFIMTYIPQYLKLKNTIPKKVLQKKTLYDGFIEYKNNKSAK